MKNNKSPGQSGIVVGNIEYSGDKLKEELYNLIKIYE